MNSKQDNLDIFSNLDEGVLAINHYNRILYFNPAAYSLLSIKAFSDLKEQPRFLWEFSENEEILGHFKNCLSDQTSHACEVNLNERWLSIRIQPLDLDSNTKGAVALISDITQRKTLEIMRREFVANASHELRTPLTVVKGFAQQIEKMSSTGSSFAECSHQWGRLMKNIDHLQNLVDDLLSLAEIESHEGPQQKAHQYQDLSNCLSQSCEALAYRAAIKQQSLSHDIDAAIFGPFSPQQINQIITNLVDNAIKYTPSKTKITVHAHVSNNGEKQIGVLKVADNGPGIAPVHLPRLFERFYRVDKARNREQGGTGLGLAIVKHIVQDVQGTVSVESTLGLGTVFTVTWPIVTSP